MAGVLRAKLWTTFLVALALGVSFGASLAVPNIAQAAVVRTAPTTASGTATDCTAGCVIYTCHGGKCTVWYCSGEEGCKVVGEFIRPVMHAQQASSGIGRFARMPKDALSVAYTKVCTTDSSCDVYRLQGGDAVIIGKVANTDAEIKRMTSMDQASLMD